METLLGPLRLAGPAIGAAGAFGFASDVTRLNADPALGAVVTASAAYRNRPGPPPRIAETAAGAVLVPGGGRVGIRRVLRRYAREWPTMCCPVVVSVSGDSPEEFAAAAAELEGVRGVAALELLIDEPDTVAATLRGVRRVCGLPVWTKLRPDTEDLEPTLHAAASAGAAAATIGGGLHAAGPDGDGYLVGPATFALVLAIVQYLAVNAPLPLIAGGGVVTAAHARAYLAAGATAVQVGSAHLANPRAAAQIAQTLA